MGAPHPQAGGCSGESLPPCCFSPGTEEASEWTGGRWGEPSTRKQLVGPTELPPQPGKSSLPEAKVRPGPVPSGAAQGNRARALPAFGGGQLASRPRFGETPHPRCCVPGPMAFSLCVSPISLLQEHPALQSGPAECKTSSEHNDTCTGPIPG